MARRLAEVAKKAGVSEARVGRVLNGKPGLSDATRQAVLTALDVLGHERPTQPRGERARLTVLGSTDGSSWSTVVGAQGYRFDPATGNTATVALPSGTNSYGITTSGSSS